MALLDIIHLFSCLGSCFLIKETIKNIMENGPCPCNFIMDREAPRSVNVLDEALWLEGQEGICGLQDL